MIQTALISSVLALLVVGVAWWQYLAAIPREKVLPRPRGTLAAMAIGGLLALLAFTIVAMRPTAATLAAIPIAGVALGLAGFFGYLLRQAPLPDGELVVAVGDKLPSFTAIDENGAAVHSADWAGKRTLLKFFRGHW